MQKVMAKQYIVAVAVVGAVLACRGGNKDGMGGEMLPPDIDPDFYIGGRPFHDSNGENEVDVTVQIVHAPGKRVEYVESEDEYHFEVATIPQLRVHSRHPRRPCPGIWRMFHGQSLLEGRSGVLLEGGHTAPVILTSDHGDRDTDFGASYVIIARTENQQFSTDVEGRLVVPGAYVRRPVARLACPSARCSDWERIQLSGERDGAWSGGRKLSEMPIMEVDEVFASFHPLGLPVKISGWVGVDVSNGIYSVAIDYAPGASGGALFDKKGDIVGILLERRNGSAKSKFGCIAPQPYEALRFLPSHTILSELNPRVEIHAPTRSQE
jgi:hypothetical protein